MALLTLINMKSIGIVVFYFGNYPWYHNYFIESCRRNPSVDFLFFSDNVTVKNEEGNIIYFPLTLIEFNFLASKKLGFIINVLNGLKICDFRPAFGLIFEDFLSKYDFWGYSDTDIILGNLRNFLDDEVLQNDYISVKDDYPSGFFSIFKNNITINNLFKKSKDYRSLFNKKENTLFEECGGAYNEVCNGINILNSSCKFETFHHVLEKNKGSVKSLFELYSIEGNIGDLIVEEEKIVFLKKYEIMMYHLTGYKTNLFSITPSKTLKPVFYINQYAFSKHKLYFNFSTINIFFKKKYLFRISKLFNQKLKNFNHILLNDGIYNYLNEIITGIWSLL